MSIGMIGSEMILKNEGGKVMAVINFDKIVHDIADAIMRQLNDTQGWMPVSNPLKELPRDRPLLVTVERTESLSVLPTKGKPLLASRTWEVSYRYVTELFYDRTMTEWSDIDAAENAIAYQYKPEPYNPDRRKK